MRSVSAAVNIEGKLEDGTVFLSSPLEEFDFMLGHGMYRSFSD